MTEAELTILSLVAQGARYGHEIQQLIDEQGLREWMTIGFSSVYYILNKLEKQKMVTSRLKPEGRGPARKMYEITEAGRGILQTAISHLLRQPRALGSGFELGLINLHVLKPPQVYQVLRQHRDDLRQQIQAVEQSWERQHADNPVDATHHIYALYTHSLSLMKADLAWLDNFMANWLQQYPGADKQPTGEELNADPHKATTRLHRRTTPDPAKMLQRLKRPKPPTEE